MFMDTKLNSKKLVSKSKGRSMLGDISLATFDRIIAAGELPPGFTLRGSGRKKFWHEEDLIAFIERRCQEGVQKIASPRSRKNKNEQV